MNRIEKRRSSIASVMILTCVAAILFAIPRWTSGLHLHPTIILWFVTVHQIAVASTIALILWNLLARRFSVAVLFAAMILCLWGPNLVATIEYSVTGKNTRTLGVANAIGITPYLNRFYIATSDFFGYGYLPTRR